MFICIPLCATNVRVQLVNGVGGGQLQLSCQYFENKTSTSEAAVSAPFDERMGCRVTLYQSAHMGEDTTVPR